MKEDKFDQDCLSSVSLTTGHIRAGYEILIEMPLICLAEFGWCVFIAFLYLTETAFILILALFYFIKHLVISTLDLVVGRDSGSENKKILY